MKAENCPVLVVLKNHDAKNFALGNEKLHRTALQNRRIEGDARKNAVGEIEFGHGNDQDIFKKMALRGSFQQWIDSSPAGPGAADQEGSSDRSSATFSVGTDMNLVSCQ